MKRYYIFIILILISLVTSCSMENSDMANGAADGQPFDLFATYEINEINYDVYLPYDIEDSIYYDYEVSNVKSSSDEWIVNFVYEPVYHVDKGVENEEVLNKLYEKLLESKSVLDERCNFEVMLFDPYESVELEFILRNQNNEESTYVKFITYLPIKMYNQSTRKTFTVGIPVNVDVLLKVAVTVK